MKEKTEQKHILELWLKLIRTIAESPMVLDVSEEERLNIFDIDNEDGVFGLSEYAVEIFEHLRKAEVSFSSIGESYLQ